MIEYLIYKDVKFYTMEYPHNDSNIITETNYK